MLPAFEQAGGLAVQTAQRPRIIAVSGGEEAGKTSCIWIACERLQTEEQVEPILDRSTRVEVLRILEINGVKVGFASRGDKADLLARSLKPLFDEDCFVIVCATRGDRSETYRYVEALQHKYEIEWIRKTRTRAGGNRELDNETAADQIIRKIREVI